MQKTGIFQSEQRANDGVVFMARAGNGVKALVAFFQFPSGDIEQPAAYLIFEDLQRLSRCQSSARSQWIRWFKAAPGRPRVRQIVFQVVLNNFYTSDWG